MEAVKKSSTTSKKWHKLKINRTNGSHFQHCDEYFLVRSVHMDVLIKKRKVETDSSTIHETVAYEEKNRLSTSAGV